MSDPPRFPEGILPNFTHYPTQPFIHGPQVHSLNQHAGNLFPYPPIYPSNFPLYNPYIPHNVQHSMAQPYMGAPIPNPTFYQSLPIPPNPQPPFNDLKGSILPPIHSVYEPHMPSLPKPPGYIQRPGNRLARPTRREAAVTLQKHWRGYRTRKLILPILKLSKYAVQRKHRKVKNEIAESTCRSLAGEIISQAVEVMVTNFVLDWLQYRAYLILLDLECFVIRDKMVDEVISEYFIDEIIRESLLEVITEDVYSDFIDEETRDILLTELGLPRNRDEMKKLTTNEIEDTMLESGILDEFVFSTLIRRLDTERYDLANAREMEGVRNELIMGALLSMLNKYES